MDKNRAKKAITPEMTVDQIREKGKKLGFSYVQSLTMYLFEEIMQWISQSELKDTMWLKPEEMPTRGKSKKVVPNRIIYYKKTITYPELYQAMDNLLIQRKKEGIELNYKLLFFDRQIEIVLTCQVEHIEVPFKLIVRPIWQEELFPEEGTYQPLFLAEEKIQYKLYPMELNLAEYFYKILDRLELVGNMKPYAGAYEILTTHPVEGRRISVDLAELLTREGMNSVEERWETIRGYSDYKYMEKRWNKYRKEINKKDVAWKDVINLLNEFFTPLWDSIQQSRVFLSDWMPHLGRYLD